MIAIVASPYHDGFPGTVAHCDDMPELLGHGADAEEAVDDFFAQLADVVVH